jgi:radical SAM protein (TIGR01212 family)
MANSVRRSRWNYFKDRLIDQFGEVIYKVGVDAGFDCPNRDGTKAWGGCAYCSQQGSLSPHQDPKLGIVDQILKGRSFVQRRYKANRQIVYFQAFTNTYAAPQVLRERYQAALVDDKIVGLSVATRPDCVDSSSVEVLKEFSQKVPYFTVELGLQSAYQNQKEWINRQETLEDYIKAMKLLQEAKLNVVSHVILGFPGEDYAHMQDTVDIAVREGSWGLKLQMLHVIKGTKLAHIYLREKFPLMSLEEYGEVVIKLIERIPPEIQIHRITGETDNGSLVAPDWVRHKTQFFDWFDRELEKRDSWQGKALGYSPLQKLKRECPSPTSLSLSPIL